MNEILDLISQRRAVKLFEPVEISRELRQQILNAARHAPSSFNLQPYRFYWVQSEVKKAAVAKLCLRQKPAETASALIVAVADLKSLSVTSQDQLEWMRTSNLTEEKIRDYERKATIGRILFKPGPFGIFAAIKWTLFRLLNLRMVRVTPSKLHGGITAATRLAPGSRESRIGFDSEMSSPRRLAMFLTATIRAFSPSDTPGTC